MSIDLALGVVAAFSLVLMLSTGALGAYNWGKCSEIVSRDSQS